MPANTLKYLGECAGDQTQDPVIKSLDANGVINLHSDISPFVPALDGRRISKCRNEDLESRGALQDTVIGRSRFNGNRRLALLALSACRRPATVLRAASGQGVSYSRRKVFYSTGKRSRAPLHTYATVVGSVV
jgi:hypothetical protein